MALSAPLLLAPGIQAWLGRATRVVWDESSCLTNRFKSGAGAFTRGQGCMRAGPRQRHGASLIRIKKVWRMIADTHKRKRGSARSVLMFLQYRKW